MAESPRDETRPRIVAGLGATTTIIGALLPWIDLKPMSLLLMAWQAERWPRSGWMLAGDFPLGAGRTVVALGVVALIGVVLGSRLLTALPAGLTLALTGYYLVVLWFDGEFMAFGDPGAGLYLTVLGALVAIVAGLRLGADSA